MPSANAPMPVPASVVTKPAGEMTLMRPLESATCIKPSAFTVMPAGLKNAALVPNPSAHEATPLPAKVVVAPPEVTRRMRLFPLSAQKISPVTGWAATPLGEKKLATAPVPSAHAAAPLPARVLTTPSRVTLRIL